MKKKRLHKNKNMSLLSEEVSNVGQCTDLVVNQQAIVYPPVADHLAFMSGTFKQAIGYVFPRAKQWTYVIDVKTGKPLQLPEGHIPLYGYFTPMQDLPFGSQVDWYWELTASPEFPENDYYDVEYWDSAEYNGKTVDDVLCQIGNSPYCGLSLKGYNWVTMYNDYWYDYIPDTGCLKFVMEYI